MKLFRLLITELSCAKVATFIKGTKYSISIDKNVEEIR